MNKDQMLAEMFANRSRQLLTEAERRDDFAAKVDVSGVAVGVYEALVGEFPAYADAKTKQDWYAKAEAAYRYHRADAMLRARQT